MRLERSDFLALVAILAALPQWAGSADSRRKFLRALLLNLPRADQVLGGIDLDGAPVPIAEGAILDLLDAGEVAPNQSAFEFFLRSLVDRVTDLEKGEFLRELLERAQWKAPAVAVRLGERDWKGEDDPTDRSSVLEKVVGENTLRHVVVLALGVQAAEAVCRIRGPQGMGTGFLIAPDLLMTNNHVIDRAERLLECDFDFRYQVGEDDAPIEPVPARALASGAFITDSDLDFTVLALNPDSAARVGIIATPLAIRGQIMEPGDRVAIIQHPGGLYKQIAFQSNKVQYGDRRIVQYTTTTQEGSSGAPVFNDRYEVVAIHTSGGRLQQPGDGGYYYRNQGTSMLAVLDRVRAMQPTLLSRLTLR